MAYFFLYIKNNDNYYDIFNLNEAFYIIIIKLNGLV